MTDLGEMIAPGAVLAEVAVGSKRALFAALGAAAGAQLGLDPKLVTQGLAEREKLGTTGFGGGVAVPHARVTGIDRVRAIFARLARPIAFSAVDELPVDIVVALLSPPDAGAEHLKALARVSRTLRDRGFADKLRGAGSPDALYALLTGVEARDAA